MWLGEMGLQRRMMREAVVVDKIGISVERLIWYRWYEGWESGIGNLGVH